MREDESLANNPRVAIRDLSALHDDAFGWAMCVTRGRRDEAEEVLQTAYLLIHEGRARFDGFATLRTWLFGVIRNVARSRWRRRLLRLRFERTEPEATLVAAADEAETGESAATLARLALAFAALPGRQREVLELVFHRGFSIEQAAQVVGVSIGTARTHYERGKARLRREFGS